MLRRGSIGAPLYLDAQVIVLARRRGRQWALTASNNDERPRRIRVALPPALRAATVLIDALSSEHLRAQDGHLTLEIPARYGRVILWN